MTLNQIVTRLMRIFGRKGVGRGAATGAGGVTKRTPDKAHPAVSARDGAKRARQSARITKRIGR